MLSGYNRFLEMKEQSFYNKYLLGCLRFEKISIFLRKYSNVAALQEVKNRSHKQAPLLHDLRC